MKPKKTKFYPAPLATLIRLGYPARLMLTKEKKELCV